MLKYVFICEIENQIHFGNQGRKLESEQKISFFKNFQCFLQNTEVLKPSFTKKTVLNKSFCCFDQKAFFSCLKKKKKKAIFKDLL